jgi:hypothetical protein
MADDNETNRNDALTTLLGLATKVDASAGEPDFKVAEVATPFLVLVGDALGNLQRTADALEGLHNLELGKQVTASEDKPAGRSYIGQRPE